MNDLYLPRPEQLRWSRFSLFRMLGVALLALAYWLALILPLPSELPQGFGSRSPVGKLYLIGSAVSATAGLALVAAGSRYSLRTMLLLLTIFGGWLGWARGRVLERQAVIKLVESRGGDANECTAGDNNWDNPKECPLIPPLWRVMGAVPNRGFNIPLERFSEAELQRIRNAFTESWLHQSKPRTTPVPQL